MLMLTKMKEVHRSSILHDEYYVKIMIRPVRNSYLVQERFLSIHKESVGNLEIEPHSDGLLTMSHVRLAV